MSQTSEWKMSFVTLASAGRIIADVALQEWRFQSPLKWNYGALHTSVAFECFQQYAMKEKRLRQLENDTDTQTIDTKELEACTLSILATFLALSVVLTTNNSLSSFWLLCFSLFHQIAIFLTRTVIKTL